MNNDTDPVDRALASLRSTKWTGGAYNSKLEENLVREFHNTQSGSRFGKHRTLLAALAALCISGAGFAAAGGPEAVKRWIVTLTVVGPNGEQIDNLVLEAIENEEDGSVTMDLNLGERNEGTITLQKIGSADGGADEVDDKMEISVNLSGELGDADPGDGAENSTVQLRIDASAAQAGSAKPDGTVVLRKYERGEDVATYANQDGSLRKIQVIPLEAILGQMDTTDPADWWFDEQGQMQELYVLPRTAQGATGFHVYLTHVDDGGEQAVRFLGSITGVDPETTELTKLTWDEENEDLGTLLFTTDQGREVTIQINTTEGSKINADAPRQMQIRIGTSERSIDMELRQVNPDDK